MRISILDGYTLNPGDLSWDAMKNLGEVRIFERTNKTQILDRCLDQDIILTNKVPISREIISQLPTLKYIGVLATGYNVVDITAAVEQGVIVTNIPSYGTHSVAQHAFALILEMAEDLSSHFESVQNKKWENQDDFSYTTKTTYELKDKILGIIGYGAIARQVIKIARSFELEILVFTSHPDKNDEVTFVSKKELFRKSDIISIHTSLRPSNKGIINKNTLGLMKQSAFLVNTSRGGFVNEQDLAEFLNSGKISGAALDVLSAEPPTSDNPLLKAKNCRITPHIGWSTIEARRRLMNICIDNIKAFQEGKPSNVVS